MLEQWLRQGQPLGHYRLVRLLGQGGFAEVYLGEHIHLNTQVAVKVLHAKLLDQDVIDFKREAQTVAHLLHPNIVRVLDFGVEDAIPYLVMDYAPNGTLRHAFAKGSRLPLPAVVSFTKQVAEALQYAHAQRLIHRDIKPENMLLGLNRQVLLSDFGIALVLQSLRTHSTQNIAGTIPYMAPEQIQAHPCPASDQYSLGIVVYEWLCGTRPFQGSYTEIAVKQSMVPPPPLRVHVPEIAPVVEMMVMRALQKDPQHRFADVRTFALALEQAANQPETQQHRSTFILPQTSPFPSSTNNTPSTFMPASSMPTMTPLATPQAFHAGSASSHLQTPYPSSAQQTPYPSAPQFPHYGHQPVFDPSLPHREQKRVPLSRRAFLLGGAAVGLVAVGAIAADVILTQTSHTIQSPINQAISNLVHTGSTQSGLQATPELTFSQHTALVWIVRWSPDGKYIASGSQDGTMLVWTADKGEVGLSVRSVVQPVQSDDYPWSIAWSPRKDQKVAVGFVDGTIQVLDANNGQRLPSLNTHAGLVIKLAWSPDERYLAVGGSDNIVRVYQYPSWNIVTTYQEHTNSIRTLAWSPDGQTLASGSEDTTVRLWNPLSGQTKLIYKGHSNSISTLSWSSDSKQIVSTAQDQTAKVWQVSTDTTLYTYNAPGGAPIGEANWSHDDSTIAVYGGDATIYLLDAQTGKVKRSYFTGVVFSFSWSPDDTRIVTASYKNIAEIWRVG